MLVLATVAGTALAGHLPGAVKSYTGCLVPKDGVVIKVKEGNAPAGPCTAGMTEVHLSGGDITKISVTGALTGGGDSGEVTISLKPEFTLPSGCANGQVAKWNGSGWTCANDNDTAYTAGTGLALSGTQFSIASDYRAKNTPDCGSGQFATGFDGDGDIQCATPPASNLTSFTAVQANFVNGDGVPDDGAPHTYVTRSLPAGSYVVIGKGVLERGDDDIGFQSAEGAFGCGVSIGSQSIDESRFAARDNEELERYGFALTGVVATQGGNLILWCDAESDADLVSVRNARVVALRVG